MSDRKAVMIKWADAHGNCKDEWESADIVEHLGQDGVEITSVGLVLQDTKKHITIVMNVNERDNAVNGRLTIPKGWINSIVYLIPENVS